MDAGCLEPASNSVHGITRRSEEVGDFLNAEVFAVGGGLRMRQAIQQIGTVVKITLRQADADRKVHIAV